MYEISPCRPQINTLWRSYRRLAVILAVTSAACNLFASAPAETSNQPICSFFSSSVTASGGRISPLFEASDGFVYGLTSSGGTSNLGTLFRTSKLGHTYTQLLSFTGSNGAAPYGRLVEGTNGTLYGVTSEGGANNSGTLFQVNKSGAGLITLHTFGSDGSDGSRPFSGLVKGNDGTLYGVASGGGGNAGGTVFKINQDGTGYAILHSFTGASDPAGSNPFAGMILGSDGNLYGTTDYGGAQGLGTVYKIGTDGSGYTVLHSFSGPAGQDSRAPLGDLVEGTNGMLYGTSYFGGTNDQGSVFSLNKGGLSYSVIHSFSGGLDGKQPVAGLARATNGALYGTTRYGGSNDLGTVFRLDTDGGGCAMLRAFSGGTGDGAEPAATLLPASNGAFYGSTLAGGTNGFGEIFKFFFCPARVTITRLDMNAEGVLLSFGGGVPGQDYQIQSVASTGSNTWSAIGTVAAGEDGTFQFLDTNSPASLSRFYRTAIP
jgi:uncharacterized repeat protein (TIGR03803 family)